MKFSIVSRINFNKIIQIIHDLRLDYQDYCQDYYQDNNYPDFVITFGGDGTIIDSERLYPGVPKITVRESEGGYRCLYEEKDIKDVLLKIKNGYYKIKEEMKLKTEFKGKTYFALNEVQLHNENPTKAIRFSIFVNNKPIYWKVVGDGVVIATPFGSTAYFTSIGGSKFDEGIGIGLNNPFKFEHDDFISNKFSIFNKESIIKIRLLRERGILLFDNDPRMISVKEEEEIIINVSEETAKFVVIR